MFQGLFIDCIHWLVHTQMKKYCFVFFLVLFFNSTKSVHDCVVHLPVYIIITIQTYMYLCNGKLTT